jgi:hypothetical protein
MHEQTTFIAFTKARWKSHKKARLTNYCMCVTDFYNQVYATAALCNRPCLSPLNRFATISLFVKIGKGTKTNVAGVASKQTFCIHLQLLFQARYLEYKEVQSVGRGPRRKSRLAAAGAFLVAKLFPKGFYRASYHGRN